MSGTNLACVPRRPSPNHGDDRSAPAPIAGIFTPSRSPRVSLSDSVISQNPQSLKPANSAQGESLGIAWDHPSNIGRPQTVLHTIHSRITDLSVAFLLPPFDSPKLVSGKARPWAHKRGSPRDSLLLREVPVAIDPPRIPIPLSICLPVQVFKLELRGCDTLPEPSHAITFIPAVRRRRQWIPAVTRFDGGLGSGRVITSVVTKPFLITPSTISGEAPPPIGFEYHHLR